MHHSPHRLPTDLSPNRNHHLSIMAHLLNSTARITSTKGRTILFEKRGDDEYAMIFEKSNKVVPGLEYWVCSCRPMDPVTGKRCGGRATKQPGKNHLSPNLSSPHSHPPEKDDRLVISPIVHPSEGNRCDSRFVGSITKPRGWREVI